MWEFFFPSKKSKFLENIYILWPRLKVSFKFPKDLSPGYKHLWFINFFIYYPRDAYIHTRAFQNHKLYHYLVSDIQLFWKKYTFAYIIFESLSPLWIYPRPISQFSLKGPNFFQVYVSYCKRAQIIILTLKFWYSNSFWSLGSSAILQSG